MATYLFIFESLPCAHPIGLCVNEYLAKEALDKQAGESKVEWQSSILCIGQVVCKRPTCLNQISLLVTLLLV